MLYRDRVGFLHFSLVHVIIRRESDGEVGDLLPCNYKFGQRGFPMSKKQEEGMQITMCFHTMPHKEIDEEQDTCDASSDYCLEVKELSLKDKTNNTTTCDNRSKGQVLCRLVFVSIWKFYTSSYFLAKRPAWLEFLTKGINDRWSEISRSDNKSQIIVGFSKSLFESAETQGNVQIWRTRLSHVV